MIELFFTICMAGAPERCEDHALLYTDVSPMTCLMGAQPQLASWVQMHPGWTVTSWKCRAVDTRLKEARL